MEKRKLELILEIIQSIPETLKDDRPYCLSSEGSKWNCQEYTEENCKEFNIPFLSKFVDIDTYIDKSEGRMRIQGIYPIKTICDLDLSIEQLEFLLKLVKCSDWVTGRSSLDVYDGTYTLRVHAYSVYK
jgi:hypothetical protein